MTKHIVFITLLMVLSNCAVKSQKTNTNKSNDSQNVEQITISEYRYPLFSPINLQVGETVVNLTDYFPNIQSYNIDSVPAGLSAHQHLEEVTLTGQMTKPIDHLDVTVNGENYSIVVKNHDKIQYNFTYKTSEKYDDLQIKGSFNGWSTSATSLEYNDGAYTFNAWLSPGTYEYVFVDEGKEFNDETNPNLKPNGFGGQNNLFTVGNEKLTSPFIYTKSVNNENGYIQVDTDITNTPMGITSNSFVCLWENQLNNDFVDTFVDRTSNQTSFLITIPENAKNSERSFIRFYYGDTLTGVANDLLIPLQNGMPVQNVKYLNRKDMQDNVMYEVFVDRFYDGDKSNDHPVNSEELFPGTDWEGGDLQGLYQKMKDGYFTDLHVNDIWISPINLNPQGMYGHMTEYGVDTKFTGYHGYWPVSLAKIDPRFGDEKTLNEIIELAHKDDTNIIIDYVANHVHEEHPIVKDSLGWITAKYLPDGRKNNRLYDEQRLTTWFDDFMPTLDLEREDVADVMTDSAVFWFKKYDIDGFRHDATKHIPNSFWRTLTYKLKTQVGMPQNRQLYQIGETYGNNELINSYVNTGMLDAQFDFNMFDAAFNGILNDDYPLTQTADVLQSSLNTYGYHNLMGNISGNHDKGRSISYADGSIQFGENAKEAGYTRKIENINGLLGYKKMAQFFAFNMFIPGIPVIYYGDEIGMPGGDDPDNRRMMQFTGLNENQLFLKSNVEALALYRRTHLELIYGDTKILKAEDDVLVLLRTYLGQSTILVLNTSDDNKQISFTVDLLGVESQSASTKFGSKIIKTGNEFLITVPARGFDLIMVN